MVPSDVLVPRAKGVFVSPDGGVASTVREYAAAAPTITTRNANFNRVCMGLLLSGLVLSGVFIHVLRFGMNVTIVSIDT
jgi:hypothetical protein